MRCAIIRGHANYFSARLGAFFVRFFFSYPAENFIKIRTQYGLASRIAARRLRHRASVDEFAFVTIIDKNLRAYAAVTAMAANESLASTDTKLDSNWFSRWTKLKTKLICLRLAPLAVSHNGSILCSSFFSSPSKPPTFQLSRSPHPVAWCDELGFKRHYIIIQRAWRKMTRSMMYQIYIHSFKVIVTFFYTHF